MSKKEFDYEEYYKNYWEDEFDSREKGNYYGLLYDRVKQKLIPSNKKLKIIDVGGGNGHFLHYLGINNATVFDISDSGLDFAKKKFRYKTIKGNVLNLKPVKNNSFDTAYCFEVAEHLDYPNNLFKSISRVLKKEGTLLLSIPNGKIDGVHHKKRWKQKELITDLTKAGFVIDWIDNNPKFYPIYENRNGLKQKVLGLISKIIPNKIKFDLSTINPDAFTSMFIVCAKKK